MKAAARSSMSRASVAAAGKVPIQIIYSHEWLGGPNSFPHYVADLVQRQVMGSAGSQIFALRGSTHVEFSDAIALLPMFVARGANMVRSGMPPERILENIRYAVLQFLGKVEAGGRSELLQDTIDIPPLDSQH